MSKLIPLSRGLFATVDDEDFDWLSQWKWSAMEVKKGDTVRFYAVRMTKRGELEDKSKMVLMHRQILGADAGPVTDHRDNDGLNNQRHNIRPCTQSQNMMNSVGHADRSSRFKGVWRHTQNGNWCAQFRSRKLGSFDTEEQAARAYDAAAISADHNFALTNFPSKEAA